MRNLFIRLAGFLIFSASLNFSINAEEKNRQITPFTLLISLSTQKKSMET